MSKISLKHSGGNVVSLNSPTSAPTSADVAFKLPNADGSAGQFMKTDGSGNLSFAAVADTNDFVKLSTTTVSSPVGSLTFDNSITGAFDTYKVMLQSGYPNTNAYVNRPYSFRGYNNYGCVVSHLTLMEVAA